jgi:hypothetical protein
MFRGTVIKQYVWTACSSVVLHRAKRLAYRLQVAGCRLQDAVHFFCITYIQLRHTDQSRTVVLPECHTTASRAAGFAARLGRLPFLETRWGEWCQAKVRWEH